MKEYVQKPGVRRWHGDEFVNLGLEPLFALQKMLEPYGNMILEGCKVSFVGPHFACSPGLVAIMHGDGFKVARFAGQNLGLSVTYPFYLKIDKIISNKVYDDLVVRESSYDYVATHTTVLPSAGLFITFPNALDAPKFSDKFYNKDKWHYVGTAGEPAFLNSFGNGFTFNPGVVDNLRFKKTDKIVQLGGALDFDPLGTSTLNVYKDICLLSTGYAPDRVRYLTMGVNSMAGVFTVSFRLNTAGMLACCVTAIPGGAVMADITSGSPYGDYFELLYPAA